MEVWMCDAQEKLIDLMYDDLTSENAQCVCDYMGIGEYHVHSYPMAAERLVFIYGDQTRNFTSDEVEYFQSASTIISFNSVTHPDDLIFFIELLIDEDEASITACAIIKMLNKAFKGSNIFCFKTNHLLALGSIRGVNAPTDTFSLTEWFSVESSLFLQEIFDDSNGSHLQLIDAIASHSTLEKWDNPFDTYEYNPDYVLALLEIMSFYSVDLRNMIEQYENGYTDTIMQKSQYQEFSNVLSEIGILEMTSYEFLDKAQDAKAMSDLKILITSPDSDFFDAETLQKTESLSIDILSDAIKTLQLL